MKAHNMLWIYGLVLLAFGWKGTFAGKEDLCEIFPNNTIIGDPNSCSQYITCIDFVSHYTKCSGSTPYFDKDSSKCVKTLSSDCSVPCTNHTSEFVADPTSCYGYYYCDANSEPHYGECPAEMHFIARSKVCQYKSKTECSSYDFKYCSIVKNGVKFRDVHSCANYMTCSKGVKTTIACSSGMYFDTITGTCLSKSLVECAVHPLPTDVCGTAANPKKNVYVSDGATCQGYLYCASRDDGPDTNPLRLSCPTDKFFNAETGKCDDPVNVACTYNRCAGRSATFVVDSTRGCRHYLVCEKGVIKASQTCGNYFFNEKRGACVTQILTYPACIQ